MARPTRPIHPTIRAAWRLASAFVVAAAAALPAVRGGPGDMDLVLEPDAVLSVRVADGELSLEFLRLEPAIYAPLEEEVRRRFSGFRVPISFAVLDGLLLSAESSLDPGCWADDEILREAFARTLRRNLAYAEGIALDGRLSSGWTPLADLGLPEPDVAGRDCTADGLRITCRSPAESASWTSPDGAPLASLSVDRLFGDTDGAVRPGRRGPPVRGGHGPLLPRSVVRGGPASVGVRGVLRRHARDR